MNFSLDGFTVIKIKFRPPLLHFIKLGICTVTRTVRWGSVCNFLESWTKAVFPVSGRINMALLGKAARFATEPGVSV